MSSRRNLNGYVSVNSGGVKLLPNIINVSNEPNEQYANLYQYLTNECKCIDQYSGDEISPIIINVHGEYLELIASNHTIYIYSDGRCEYKEEL